jgi:hypothetical protein
MRWLCDDNDTIGVTTTCVMSAGYGCVTIGFRKLESSHLPSLTSMHLHVHVGGSRLAEASRTGINSSILIHAFREWKVIWKGKP